MRCHNLLSCLIGMIFIHSTLLGEEIKLTGTVTPIPQRHFAGSPPINWWVSIIHVKVGDYVKKGQCLIELDPAPLPLKRDQASVDAAKANIEALKADLELSEKVHQRRCAMLPHKASSVQSCEEAYADVLGVKARIVAAKAQLARATYVLGMTKYNFSAYQRINSGIDGQVVAINCALGLIGLADEEPIVFVEVIDDSRVYITCPIELGQIAALEEKVNADNLVIRRRVINRLPSKPLTANLLPIPRLLNNGKTTATVELDNKELRLICGEKITLSIE